MRIAVFGTGGAGGYFGAQLARGGADVGFIARGEHYRAMAERGLLLRTGDGEFRISPLKVAEVPGGIGAVDVVLLGVKAWQVRSAAEAMGPLIAGHTVVIPLQNGIEAAPELSSVLGRQHVLAGTCGVISWVSAPGEIQSVGAANFLRFGEQDNSASERVGRILAHLRGAGVNAEVPKDIQAALWSKFLVVTAMGGLGAATGLAAGRLLGNAGTRRLLESCMQEVKATAAAHGIDLDADVVPRMIGYLESLDPGSTTSLQRDIAAGRPSELDYWTGAVVRWADRKSVPVPVNRMLYDLLGAVAESRTAGAGR
jgi:2-dehydropantoate 2-reductase